MLLGIYIQGYLRCSKVAIKNSSLNLHDIGESIKIQYNVVKN